MDEHPTSFGPDHTPDALTLFAMRTRSKTADADLKDSKEIAAIKSRLTKELIAKLVED